MPVRELLKQANELGWKSLSEYQAKRLLSAYEIPITREALALDAVEAIRIAHEIGFPVAVKACSHELLHKTEGGYVSLNVTDEAGVRSAAEKYLLEEAGRLDGVLVQEMLFGPRELVLGLFRDAQFGPCVMLGLGGVMTEVFQDTTYRMAPLEALDVEEMIEDLQCRQLFGAFRGQAPVDLAALSKTLIALGRIGLEHERVAEIDINPMIVAADGSIKAADALVVLKEN